MERGFMREMQKPLKETFLELIAKEFKGEKITIDGPVINQIVEYLMDIITNLVGNSFLFFKKRKTIMAGNLMYSKKLLELIDVHFGENAPDSGLLENFIEQMYNDKLEGKNTTKRNPSKKQKQTIIDDVDVSPPKIDEDLDNIFGESEETPINQKNQTSQKNGDEIMKKNAGENEINEKILLDDK